MTGSLLDYKKIFVKRILYQIITLRKKDGNIQKDKTKGIYNLVLFRTGPKLGYIYEYNHTEKIVQ